MNTAKEILQKHKIKASHPRIVILNYMLENRVHPTAEKIYKETCSKVPSLSLTTVYNTLKMFESKNLLQVVNIDKTEQIFDIGTHLHGHFQCDICKKVVDVDIKNSEFLKEASKYSNNIINVNVNIRGICKNCEKQKK